MPGTTLTELDVAKYRRQLRDMAARLDGEVAGLEAEALRPTGTEAGGAAASQPDPGVLAAEEGVAVALFNVEGHALAEVQAALDRIDRGTFGRCAACGRAVAKARLDALPYARRCIRCEQAAGG